MAKTSSGARGNQQAAPGTSSPQDLLDAISRPSPAEKLALLRKVGILDANGKLAERYRTWGSKVSRTPEE